MPLRYLGECRDQPLLQIDLSDWRKTDWFMCGHELKMNTKSLWKFVAKEICANWLNPLSMSVVGNEEPHENICQSAFDVDTHIDIIK